MKILSTLLTIFGTILVPFGLYLDEQYLVTQGYCLFIYAGIVNIREKLDQIKGQ
jgi:hypothetical protein